MIDDCTVGGINSTVGVVEKYRVHAIDEIAAYIAWCLDYAEARGLKADMLGRTFDLKSAYKKYGVTTEKKET